jgi:hypothetical protein
MNPNTMSAHEIDQHLSTVIADMPNGYAKDMAMYVHLTHMNVIQRIVNAIFQETLNNAEVIYDCGRQVEYDYSLTSQYFN